MTELHNDRWSFDSLCPSIRQLCLIAFALIFVASCSSLFAQQSGSTSVPSELTPIQRKIETQRQRLLSADEEERRDAVMRLGSMKRADSSRVAATALNDPVPVIRATAASAVLFMPSGDAVVLLLPLLNDKKEFVRQQVVYALGETRNSAALDGLVTALERDKKPSVRGAAAVALGMIADESASSNLARTFDPGFPVSSRYNQKGRGAVEKDRFVQWAAIRSLGQMRSRASVPAVIAVITNERMTGDMRREAALSLGLIGDPLAVPVLRIALDADDPYLARLAFDALTRISRTESTEQK